MGMIKVCSSQPPAHSYQYSRANHSLKRLALRSTIIVSVPRGCHDPGCNVLASASALSSSASRGGSRGKGEPVRFQQKPVSFPSAATSRSTVAKFPLLWPG